jgi:hypothetical protein
VHQHRIPGHLPLRRRRRRFQRTCSPPGHRPGAGARLVPTGAVPLGSSVGTRGAGDHASGAHSRTIPGGQGTTCARRAIMVWRAGGSSRRRARRAIACCQKAWHAAGTPRSGARMAPR